MSEYRKQKLDVVVPRILVVGHTYVVGVNQNKLDLIGGRGRVKLGLVAPEYWRCRDSGVTYRLERASLNLQYFALPVVWNSRPGGYLLPPQKLMAICRKFRPALVHVEQEAFSLVAFEVAALCRLMRIPFSLFCWENVERFLSPVRRWTRRYVATRAHLVVAGNRPAARLLQRWGYRGEPEIMPQLGVDTNLFSPELHEAMPGVFRVGFVGRLFAGKGVDVLLDACGILRQEGFPIKLIVVGFGPAAKDLQARAVALGLERSVTWRGWVPHRDVPREMASMDALVLPSRTLPDHKEQLGHVLLEAMAMGLPVVGSSSGEIPQVIGRSDLIFREDRAPELAAILRRLMRDEKWRRQVSAYGLARVRERFSDAVIARRLEALWLDLLHHWPCPSRIRQAPRIQQKPCFS